MNDNTNNNEELKPNVNELGNNSLENVEPLVEQTPEVNQINESQAVSEQQTDFTDSVLPMDQVQDMKQLKDMDQLKDMEQLQPVENVVQSMEQIQPIEQIQPMEQVQPIDQVQPMFQQQAPMAPQFEQPQVQPIYQEFPSYVDGSGVAAEPQKKSPIVPIIIVVLSLIVLGVIGFFVYRMAFFNPAKSDPQGTLDSAIEVTRADMAESRVEMPSIAKFQDKPLSQSFDFKLKEAPDMAYFDQSSEFSLGLGLQTDVENEIAMFGFSMEAPGVSVPASKVYITPDETVIDSAFIYNKPLILNNDTFIEEWNKSDYSQMIGSIDYDGTLNDVVEEVFATLKAMDPKVQAKYESIAADYEADVNASALKLKEKLTLEYKETNDKDHVLVGVVAGADVETYIEEMAQSTEDLLYTIIKVTEIDQYAIDNTMSSFQYMMDEIVNNIYIEGDVELTFYVNKDTKRLNKIAIAPTLLIVSGEDIEAEIEILFSGETDKMENMEVVITLIPENYPEQIAVLEINRIVNVNGVRWEGIASMNDTDVPEDSETHNLFLDYNWDKKADNTQNFFVKLGYKADGAYGGEGHINLRGRMLETDDSISFSEGEISIVVDQMEQYLIGIDYNGKVIDSGSITIDRSNAVDFFSVSAIDLLSGVQSNLM